MICRWVTISRKCQLNLLGHSYRRKILLFLPYSKPYWNIWKYISTIFLNVSAIKHWQAFQSRIMILAYERFRAIFFHQSSEQNYFKPRTTTFFLVTIENNHTVLLVENGFRSKQIKKILRRNAERTALRGLGSNSVTFFLILFLSQKIRCCYNSVRRSFSAPTVNELLIFTEKKLCLCI